MMAIVLEFRPPVACRVWSAWRVVRCRRCGWLSLEIYFYCCISGYFSCHDRVRQTVLEYCGSLTPVNGRLRSSCLHCLGLCCHCLQRCFLLCRSWPPKKTLFVNTTALRKTGVSQYASGEQRKWPCKKEKVNTEILTTGGKSVKILESKFPRGADHFCSHSPG